MNRIVRTFGVAWLVTGLVACAQDAAPSDGPTIDSAAAARRVLATAPVAGGTARFIAVDEQTVLIETETVRGVTSPLADPALRGMSIAQVYEYWSGEPAPAQLNGLSFQLPDTMAPASRVLDTAPSSELSASAAALTEEEFANQFCDDFEICWTNRTGTWEREERARFWSGVVDAVRGDVQVQMRRREVFGGWTTTWVRPVFSGTVVSLAEVSGAINKRPLKFKIFEADGDLWHTAAHWD